jgi:hypothetical protein
MPASADAVVAGHAAADRALLPPVAHVGRVGLSAFAAIQGVARPESNRDFWLCSWWFELCWFAPMDGNA